MQIWHIVRINLILPALLSKGISEADQGYCELWNADEGKMTVRFT